MIDKEQFQIDYEAYAGVSLATVISRLRTKVEPFINRVETIVNQKIKEYNPKIFDVSGSIQLYQNADYKQALLEQALYLINTGDASLMTGFDPVTNVLVPLDELRKRQFSPLAFMILENSGLLNRAMRSSKFNYGDY